MKPKMPYIIEWALNFIEGPVNWELVYQQYDKEQVDEIRKYRQILATLGR